MRVRFRHCTFKVYMRAHHGFDLFKVAILNMPPIFAQMHCNAIRASRFGNPHSICGTWVGCATCLPQCRNMVDVHSEFEVAISHRPGPPQVRQGRLS